MSSGAFGLGPDPLLVAPAGAVEVARRALPPIPAATAYSRPTSAPGSFGRPGASAKLALAQLAKAWCAVSDRCSVAGRPPARVSVAVTVFPSSTIAAADGAAGLDVPAGQRHAQARIIRSRPCVNERGVVDATRGPGHGVVPLPASFL